VREVLVAAGAASVVSVGGNRVALETLGFSWVPDRYPGEGPLGGIITALTHATHAVSVITACDMPGLTPATIAALVRALDDGQADVALARGQQLEPLVGAWRPRCVAALTERFDSGERAVHRAIADLGVVQVAVTDPRALVNVNTGDELARWVETSLGNIGAMPIEEISVDDLAQRIAQGGAPLIDVRQPEEYREAHVPGALLIPLDQVPDRLDDVRSEGAEVLVICKSGARSRTAANFLATAGITALNVAGGTSAWIASGRDVHVGDQP